MQINNQIDTHLLSMKPNMVKSGTMGTHNLFLNQLLAVSPESLSEACPAEQTADMFSTVGSLDGSQLYSREYIKTELYPMRPTSYEAYDRQYIKNPIHPVRLNSFDIYP